MRHEEENIEVGSSIQLQFQRSQLPLESIFKEFIDNSLQSFLTPANRIKLEEIGISKCIIKIKIEEDKVVISDNAFGMDHEAFRRALKLNEKATKYTEGSLSEFGMGLKYAAISLGNEYTIESTSLGSNEKYKSTINSELLKQNSKTVDNEIEDDYQTQSHFTKITIRYLIRKITSINLNKLITDLSRIYHKYIENEELEILFLPNRPVKYNPPELWINDDGSEYQEDFQGEIEYDGKKYIYYGWIGILKIADTSKNGVAGFSLFKHKRIVISNYRPEKLFGKANSFPYQRIIGEINLNDWPVDFNKSSFTWNDGLQEYFIESLVEHPLVKKMIKIAKELRKNQSSKPSKEKQQKSAETIQKRFAPLAAKKRT
ncbi:MAG: ATP-binding protein, partial [Acholeplasma sp.]|nr:ATP-binding protein [Acholeplasma sp.]